MFKLTMNNVFHYKATKFATSMLILFTLLFNATQIHALIMPGEKNQGAVRIVLQVVGSNFKIIKFYGEQAKKTLEVSRQVVIENAVYGGMLKEFKEGVLDLNSDKLTGLPKWNRLQAKQLVQSEITFQWNMVEFLESKGIDSNDRLLKSAKERLFAEQEALDKGNKDENMFNNMRALRQTFIRLREKVK